MKKTNRDHRPVCPGLPLESASHLSMPALSKQEAQLRVQKVQRIKQQIEAGTYDVCPADIVRGIIRSEILRLLNMPPAGSH